MAIQRAGDVIPQVVDVVLEKRPKSAKPLHFPTKCPARGRPTPCARRATGEEGAPRCTGGFACPVQQVEQLRHFVSRRAFDIEGLGEKQVEAFFERGWSRSRPTSSRCRSVTPAEARGNRGLRRDFGAQPLRRDRGGRSIALDRFIYALGIRHVGETTALALARGYGSWRPFTTHALKVAKGDEETSAEMDALDQIGEP